MRIAVIPGDETGCGYYRLIWPAEVVQESRPDWKIEIYRPGTVKIASDRDGKVQALDGLDLDGLDLIVIQRVGMAGPARFLSWAQERGIAVVVDADDAMWAIDRRNAAYGAWNGDPRAGGMHWRWLDVAMKTADRATVTTPYLAQRYGKHGRCTVLPNHVPAGVPEIAPVPREVGPCSIGWMGFTATHPGDLKAVGGAVRSVMDRTGAVGRVIGDAAGAARDWGVEPEQVEKLGPYKLGRELYEGLTRVDVAVVPLEDSRFNRAKSALKALEFSAVGVPVVATPTPANRELAKSLPILLADSEAEWEYQITSLIEHEEGRRRRGAEARELVRRNFTLQAAAEDWAQAWESAVERRRSMSRRAGLASAGQRAAVSAGQRHKPRGHSPLFR